MKGEDLKLPEFLEILREVTHESYYSMYNLSRKDSPVDTKLLKAAHGKNADATPVTNGDIVVNGESGEVANEAEPVHNEMKPVVNGYV